MGEQYLRDCLVSVAGVEIRGGGNDDLRIRFDTHQALHGTPHHVNIYITNPAPSTVAKMRQEKAPVRVQSGYVSGKGVIFEGQVLQVRSLRESITDTVAHVLATSSENGRNYATVNAALASGHTMRDRVDVAAKAMREHGVQVGFIDDLGSRKIPGPYAAFGMAHDLLREVCEAVGATWHIQGNKLNVIKAGNTLPGGAIVLNSATGMIGLPEQTIEGVIVRCLLNYDIYPGSRLQINESSVQRAALSPAVGAGATNTQFADGAGLGVAADGFYKAWRVEHVGDSRGGPWYTEIACTTGAKPIALGNLMLPNDVPSEGDGPSGPGTVSGGLASP